MVRSYEGQCHCGAVRFRFQSEEITRGIRCNCSFCTRRAGVMALAYVAPQDIAFLEGRDALEVYRFGDRMVNHHFCRTCGVYLFHDTTVRPGFLRFNLGCIDGLDPLTLEIQLIDGRAY
jgi:hypothetical protein